MKIGEPFNPKGIFKGIYIPDAIARDADLSMGAKVCYGRLCWFCDDDGNVEATVTEIASAVGVHERQARTYFSELETAGLIRRLIRGGQKTNAYEFLWDERLSRSLRKGSEAKSTRQDTAGHSESTRQCSVPDTAGHSGSLNNVLRSREVESNPPPTPPQAEPEPPNPQAEVNLTGSLQVVIGRHARRLGIKGRGTISDKMLRQLEREDAGEDYRRALVQALERFAGGDSRDSIGQWAFDWVNGWRAEHGEAVRGHPVNGSAPGVAAAPARAGYNRIVAAKNDELHAAVLRQLRVRAERASDARGRG